MTRRWLLSSLCAVFLLVIVSSRLTAQESADFDPRTTSVAFTLGATLHTVHGKFRLQQGQIRFDPATGNASGAIVVDATSADSGNSSRDHNMHANILENAKYPEIAFLPSQISGSPNGTLQFPLPMGITTLQVAGVFALHGEDHDMIVPITVERDAGGLLVANAHSSIPYVKWGLKNSSTFVLRVSDSVDLDVRSPIKLSS